MAYPNRNIKSSSMHRHALTGTILGGAGATFALGNAFTIPVPTHPSAQSKSTERNAWRVQKLSHSKPIQPATGRQGFGLTAAVTAAGAAAAAAVSGKAPKAKRANGKLALSVATVGQDTEVKNSSSVDDQGSRVMAMVGRDGCGKSKLCAALIEVLPPGPAYAEKSRLLEAEAAENRRNFSCYNHVYSQATSPGQPATRLHLIDTPGHVDRQPLMEQALHASHGAIVVCSAKFGRAIDADCLRAIKAAETAEKPSVIFFNAIDMVDDMTVFEEFLDSLEAELDVKPVVLFAPAHTSDSETGTHLLNVLDGSICSPMGCFIDGAGADGEAPADLLKWAAKFREQQIESLAAVDEEMMEEYVERDGDVSRESIEAALRRAVHAGKIMPVVAGSARNGLGVDALQDAVRTFVPCGDGDKILESLGVSRPLKNVKFQKDAAFLGWAFADYHARAPTDHQKGADHLLEVRILDGTLKAGTEIKVLSNDTEQPGEALEEFTVEELMEHGAQGSLLKVQKAGPGDLVLVKVPPSLRKPGRDCTMVLADTTIQFDTKARSSRPKSMEKGSYTLALAYDSLASKDRASLEKALDQILAEEDGLHLEISEITGQHLLSFRGLLQVELLRERLVEEFGIQKLPLEKPRIPYVSSIRFAATASGSHSSKGKVRIRRGIEHKGGAKVDAYVKVQLEPAPKGSGVSIDDPAGDVDPTRGGLLSKEAGASLHDGIREGLRSAGPGGIPVTDVKVTVLAAEGQSEEAIQSSAEDAVHHAVEDVQTVLLEPFLELEVHTTDAADGIVQDLEKRRGCEVWGVGEGLDKIVSATAPLREMTDYPSDLARLSGNKGYFTSKFDSYREMDKSMEQQVLKGELHTVSSH
eukprot:TRINITY_DN27230_c0_g1_i1.p1 TRINITY_DN27230_c0_g1~~TRINITY_DN27230_c0_g1_i1.p1  ORF type:complete len:883 (-),score=191.64 TRINITY_DN27230_c0_g1_i1:27-2627(-)